MQTLRTAQAALGKGCLASSFICVYLFTGELYPTEIRWVPWGRQGRAPGTSGGHLLGLPKQDPSLLSTLSPPPPGIASPLGGVQAIATDPAHTPNRQMGMGFTSVNARLGGLVAPLITAIGEFSTVLPPVGFGATPILAGLAVCFLAETRDAPLVETIVAMERR